MARLRPVPHRPVPVPRLLGLPAPAAYLALGLATAPLFALGPLLRRIHWTLSSVAHELGHSAAGWLVGIPSVPALRPDGHAATLHLEPLPLVATGMTAGLLLAATRIERREPRLAALGLVLALHPLLAWTPLREVFVLAGGHLAEVAIGCVLLWRAMSGGTTAHALERALHGTVGWALVGANVLLAARLALDEGARRAYAANGSFGLAQDYVRLAGETPLGSVAAVGAVATAGTLGALASTLLLFRWAWRRRLAVLAELERERSLGAQRGVEGRRRAA